jgi:L-alanine-DL-glutamate epimerase-like enolase superfamily enzyme
MKIARITAWQKTLPLAEPYWLSGGRLKFEALDSTLVRIDSDDGLAGWGEGCPWGHTYLPAFGGGIRAALELLAPVLVGRDPRDIDALNRAMDLALPGHPYAKSPLDIALWDILGQSAGLPLYALLSWRKPSCRAPASAAMPCRRISVSSLPKAPGRGCGTSRGGTTSTTSAARAR